MHFRGTVGILGASGLIGLQLTALAHHHPGVAQVLPFSRQAAGKALGQMFPAFKHLAELRFQAPEPALLHTCDLLFLALPHGESFPYVEALENSAIGLIDLSGDFRLQDPELYQTLYRKAHLLPAELHRFHTCIPEINATGGVSDMKGCRLSLQGCTATAVSLALFPLLSEGLITSRTVIADAKVSSSGSGRGGHGEAQRHFARSNAVRVHKLLGQHRHAHESTAFLRQQVGYAPRLFLNTYSVDMVRGMLCTLYVRFRETIPAKRLFSLYRDHYGAAPFIRLMRLHSGYERYPNPKLLLNTNFCDIGFEVHPDTGHGVLLAALDNLIKGGAGQALQCFNRLCGFEETVGLPAMGVYPG